MLAGPINDGASAFIEENFVPIRAFSQENAEDMGNPEVVRFKSHPRYFFTIILLNAKSFE